jgi:hypothetical protein
MKNLIIISCVILLFLVQLALADLKFFYSPPNILLVYLSVLLLFLSFQEMLLPVITCGVLLDFFSGTPDGVMLASLLAGVSLAYYLGEMIFTERTNNFLNIFYVLTATIGFTLTAAILNNLARVLSYDQGVAWNNLLTFNLGAAVIFNLLFLYPVYLFYLKQIDLQRLLIPKHESI